MSVGIVVVVGYMIWEAYTGSFKGKNAITGLWALATYVGYFIGENCKSNICKTLIMWIVLISLVALPFFIKLV